VNLGRHIYLSLAVGGLLLFFPVLNLVGSVMVTIFLLLPSFAYPNLLSQVNVKSMKRKLSLSSWLGLAGGALLASTVLVYGYLLRLSPFNPGSLLRIETLTRLSVILSYLCAALYAVAYYENGSLLMTAFRDGRSWSLNSAGWLLRVTGITVVISALLVENPFAVGLDERVSALLGSTQPGFPPYPPLPVPYPYPGGAYSGWMIQTGVFGVVGVFGLMSSFAASLLIFTGARNIFKQRVST